MHVIIAITLLLLLSACDGNERQAATGSQADSTATAAPPVTPPTARPHGTHDPHQDLSPSQQIKVALQHKREGRTTLAIDTLSQALARHGNDKSLLAVRSTLYLETRQLSAALKDMNAALDLDPDDATLLVNRAEVYRQFGRPQDALADLDRALAIDEDLVPALFNRGTIHYQNEDYGNALADFDRCIAVDPHVAGPYFNRAAVRDRLGERQAAIADLKRFIELTSNDSWKQKARELLGSWESGNPASPAPSKDQP